MELDAQDPQQDTESAEPLAPSDSTRLVAELQALGLSTYQAQVLLELVRVRSANGVQLANLTGIAWTTIYQVMNDLTQQGLAERLPTGGPAVWASAGWETVLDLLDAAGVERLSQQRAGTRRVREVFATVLPADSSTSSCGAHGSDLQPTEGCVLCERRGKGPIDGEPTEREDRPGPPLTEREERVLRQIERLAARRADGTIEAGMIGSAVTCEALAQKGYIKVELESVGLLGGHYYRYRPTWTSVTKEW